MTARDDVRRRALWVTNPQQTRLRRLLVKIHLWSALSLGLYIVMISVTGSAVVARREASRWLLPPRFVTPGEVKLTEAELQDIVLDAYGRDSTVTVQMFENRVFPASAYIERNGRTIERRFNPYSGEDLGDPFPLSIRILEWLVDLHDNLLSGPTGRRINGIGGALFLVNVLTGAILWWPGSSRWLHSMTISFKATGYRFVWRLHSFLGFWSFALLLIWGLTGFYFAFPGLYEDLIDLIDPDLTDFYRPGEKLLLGALDAHFGRFDGMTIRVLWILLGLVPAALFVTGFLLWWKKRPKRS